MDRDDTPSTLDEELHHEARGGEGTLTPWQNPGGNEESGHEGGADDGATTTGELGDVTNLETTLVHIANSGIVVITYNSTTDTSTSLHENRCAGGTGVVEPLLCKHEGSVGVLAGVTVEVEPRHEDDAVNAHLPLLLEHDLSLSPESTSRNTLLARLLGLNELLGFREADTDEADSNGKSGSDPEDSLPALNGCTDTKVGACSTYVAERVTLLQDTGHKTTSVGWAILESHCDSVTVHTTHEQAEQTADSQELLEGCAVDCADLEQTKDPHVLL